MTTLQTPRLTLQPLTLRDGWLMWRTFKIPHFLDGLNYDGPVSLWFALRKVFHHSGHRFSIRLQGRPIGRVWLTKEKKLGYWLHPDFQGKGYAIEAVQHILSQQEETVYAECQTWNAASCQVLQKSGFQMIGTEDGKHLYVWSKCK